MYFILEVKYSWYYELSKKHLMLAKLCALLLKSGTCLASHHDIISPI